MNELRQRQRTKSRWIKIDKLKNYLYFTTPFPNVLWFDDPFCILMIVFLSFIRVLIRRRPWYPTPVLLPGKSHGRRSLVGCSPWGHEVLDMTERLHFHLSLSCIGEGNGNPLQCSCLENPRDGWACWAAVYGVAQSWTRLKRRSSSSSRVLITFIIFLIFLKI